MKERGMNVKELVKELEIIEKFKTHRILEFLDSQRHTPKKWRKILPKQVFNDMIIEIYHQGHYEINTDDSSYRKFYKKLMESEDRYFYAPHTSHGDPLFNMVDVKTYTKIPPVEDKIEVEAEIDYGSIYYTRTFIHSDKKYSFEETLRYKIATNEITEYNRRAIT